MSRRLSAFGLGLCFLPLACASSDGPGPWSGSPSPSGSASTGNTASAGSSSGTQASGAGAVSGVSSGGSGGTSPSSGSGSGSAGGSSSGNGGSGSSGGSGSGSSGGSDSSGSSGGGGVPLGGGDGGPNTQSKTIPDVFADAGAYAPPAEAGSGEHHPGESCMQSGCHGSPGPGGQLIEPFLIAGTVFKDYAGTIPYPDVEVRVQDANGRTYTTYSRRNGNFYMGGGGGSLALPAIVAARDATTTRAMVTQLTTAGMGSCASAGCHVVGGSPSTGAYYPIHVP